MAKKNLVVTVSVIVAVIVIVIIIGVVLGIYYGLKPSTSQNKSSGISKIKLVNPNEPTILSLIAIFKNESHIMEEWIHHYLNEGVSKFYLVDNNSNDNYLSILQPFIDSNIVKLTKRNEKYKQTEIYNDILKENPSIFGWIMIVDLDEFLYSTNGKITDYLKTLDNSIGQISVPWKMFGSSGFEKQPDSVIKNFTWRESYKNGNKLDCKSILRIESVLKLKIHIHEIDEEFKTIVMKGDESNYDSLRLNHYAIQSKEWFMNIKMTRGDVSTSRFDTIRNLDYFTNYDYKDIQDFDLKNKVY